MRVSFLFAVLTCAPFVRASEPDRRANFLVDVSAAVVRAAVQPSVDRQERVREQILETPVTGTSRITGNLTTELVPDSARATIDIVFRGGVHALTVAHRPAVYIHAVTLTSLDVRRRLILDDRSMSSHPGAARARSHTTLLDINTGADMGNLAISFATKSFHRNKHYAEQESAQKAALRLSDRLGEEVAPRLAAASKMIGGALRPLKEADALEFLHFSTTTDALRARLRISTPKVATGPAPPLPLQADLGVRVHEGALNEAARAFYAGGSFTLNEVSKFYDEVTLGLIRGSRLGDEPSVGLKVLEGTLASLGGKDVTVMLSRDDPLTFAFRDGAFTVAIHIVGIRQAGVSYAGMRVEADYRLINPAAGLRAIRQGAVRFLPAGPVAGKSVEQPVGFRVAREALFAEILNEQLMLSALPLPRLAPPQGSAGGGWLGLTWGVGQ